MKKLVLIPIVFIFTSCAKDYLCTCTESKGAIFTKVVHGDKKEATEKCDADELVTETYSLTCELQ